MITEFSSQQYKKILAVSIGGLGDTILFSPLLKALRIKYPEAHIELLVSNRLAQEIYSYAKEVSHITFANFNRPSLFLKVLSLIPLLGKIQIQKKFDIGFYATGINPKFGQFMKKVGIVKKIACAPSVPIFSTDFECNLKLARSVYNAIGESDVFIPLKEKADLEVKKVLENNNLSLKSDRLVAIYPSVELPHRPRWELKKLMKVIKLIKDNGFDGKIVVIGSKIEGEEWSKTDKEKLVDEILAGKLSISGTAALLRKCCLVLGNDGGLMHVAGTVGCPIVVIMANTPMSYRPPGKKVKIIHSKHTCCNGLYPNRPKDCKIAKCTEDIHIVEVVRDCISFLG
jgi:ADP-heptose:LPS heptosyltransferase